MSRCFPYPPPGYVRNPVAVAEAESTAKLQKEREKAERKKEKRSDRKDLQQGETSKHSKRSHKKRKHEDTSIAVLEPKKVSKESVEQLEKSGLSEEHGAPFFVQTRRDSPESSQDSSKRRKVILPSPSQTRNGNILRIKIKRDHDSFVGLVEKTRVLEKPSVQNTGLASSLLGKQSSIDHHSKVNVDSTAAAQQRINGDSQAVQKQMSTQLPASIMQRDDPKTSAKIVQRINPQSSVAPARPSGDLRPEKMPRGVVPLPVRVMGRFDPLPASRRVETPPAKMLQRVDPQLPSDIQRKYPPAATKGMQKETSTAAIRQPVVPHLQIMQNTKVELRAINPVNFAPKDEPSSSGRNAAVPLQESKQSRSDRKKTRKSEKKEKKIRDLFVTWNPLSFEMEDSDLGEQDWLLGSTRNSDASMTCRASDGSVPFQSMEQQPLLQPRATFLPDLHIYQLPYVVPF